MKNVGKHSMNVVHRVVKRRKKAGARSRGSMNRRLITLDVKDGRERLYHFTKGKRDRAA